MSTKDDLLKRIKNANEGVVPPEVLIVTHKARNIEISIAELKEVLAANPEHPLAAQWAGNLSYPPEHKLVVERADLEAILTNKLSKISRSADEVGGLNAPTSEKVVSDETFDPKSKPATDSPAPSDKKPK